MKSHPVRSASPPLAQPSSMRATAVAALIAAAAPAHAGGPEQLYEPGPGAGHTSIEYNGQFGRSGDAERAHSVEAFRGASDRLALGVEVEVESEEGDLRAEELGIGAIIALTNEQASFEVALLVQAGITTDGDFPQLEARLIVEHETESWHALGNAIVRRVNADERGTMLGYAALVERKVTEDMWFGAELSGQAGRIAGYSDGLDAGAYLGPSVAFGWDLGDEREVGLGVKYLWRLGEGDQYRNNVRLVVSMEF